MFSDFSMLAVAILFSFGALMVGFESIRQAKKSDLRARYVLSLKLACLGLFCVCSIAWLVGGEIRQYYGGTVQGGRIENDQHFLSYKTEFIPVDKDTWEFLECVEVWTGQWCWAVGALGLVGLMVISFIENRRLDFNLESQFGIQSKDVKNSKFGG